MASALTWPKADYSRIPYGVFTDREIYEREQERIFRGLTWSLVGLEAEIPRPGDFKTSFVGDTPIVITRDTDGDLRCFVNRCAHRGTTLVREENGNATTFTCVYHHWCYDSRGCLKSIPFRRGIKGKGGMPKDFDMAKHGLHVLQVASHRGVIFASFAQEPEPLADYLGPAACQFLDRLFFKPIEVIGYMRQRIPANWKLYVENLRDPYHAGLLHQFSTTYGLFRNTQRGGTVLDRLKRHEIHYSVHGSDDQSTSKQEYAGIGTYDATLRLRDAGVFGWQDEIGDGRAVMFLSTFPNAVFQQLSNSLATRQIRPRGPDEFELYWTCFGFTDDSAELRQQRFVQANLIGPAGFSSMEDGEAPALIQRAIRREAASHSVVEMGGLGPVESQDTLLTEMPIRGFWAHYTDIMGLAS